MLKTALAVLAVALLVPVTPPPLKLSIHPTKGPAPLTISVMVTGQPDDADVCLAIAQQGGSRVEHPCSPVFPFVLTGRLPGTYVFSATYQTLISNTVIVTITAAKVAH